MDYLKHRHSVLLCSISAGPPRYFPRSNTKFWRRGSHPYPRSARPPVRASWLCRRMWPVDFPRSLPGKHCDIPCFLLPYVFIFKSIHFLESCQNCKALLELVLIICVRTDPVRGILRVPELCMLTEAGNESTHGLLPGMAHEPTRALRFCIGCHQLHQAAREAQCCWCDDPRAGVVEVEGLSIQWLFEVWASRVPGCTWPMCHTSNSSNNSSNYSSNS